MQFHKRKETDRIQWGRTSALGDMYFTFDGEKIYNFWKDYPEKLTPEEIKIFKDEAAILARLKE